MISINLYEILFQMVNFFVLLLLMKKFLLTPLSNYLNQRVAGIEKNINQAESSKDAAVALVNEQKELLKEARLEAKTIREDAKEATERERKLLAESAKEEASKIIIQAKRDLEQDIENVKRQLTDEVSELVVSLTAKILKTKLTDSDKHVLIKESLGKI